MNATTQIGACSECATELPANAPAGLCPRCLIELGLSLGDEVSSHNPRPEANSHTGPGDARTGQRNRTAEMENSRIRYFGDYQLLEEIARGGMGVIYRARQLSLNRIVAVKMLLFGKFSSDDFVRRFRTEAEAAASLQHPNIVSIHEIGQHEGQHYFSMDFVDGQNLAQIVKDRPLPAKRAAAYLQKIAQAVHYAHQHGVLHRDLKPSNVIIDNEDQPRITDFGLAKQLKTDSELTATGHVLGSPNFMPPEQADAQGGPVRIESDVYSLGALLYQLLTGRPPFVGETLEATLLQVLNSEPISPRLLVSIIPRDLETICLKCLNKQPAHRYPDAAALATDLGRWLRGEPINARPAGLPEKAWRWCRRKPAAAGLFTSTAVLLMTVALGSSSMLIKEKRARVNEARLRLAAQAAEKSAKQAADKSQQVALLLEHILQGVGPATQLAAEQTVLDLATAQVRKDFVHQPETQLELETALARVYHQAGLYQPLEEIAREVLCLSRACFREPHVTISASLCLLGDVLMHRRKLEEAETVSRQALGMQRAIVTAGDPGLVNALNTLGVVLQRAHKLEEAEALFREALEIKIKTLGPEHQEVAGLLENIAHVLRDKSDYSRAEALYGQVLTMRRNLLGEDHEDVATSLHNLARVSYDQRKFPEAGSMFEDALARRRKLLGNAHPAVATSAHSLGLVMEAEARWTEAESLFREALTTRRKLLGETHDATIESLHHLAGVLGSQGKTDEAQGLLRSLDGTAPEKR